MGTRGTEIVDMDVNELIGLLNKAYADEWLAYYQYWLGAKLATGPMRDAVMAELIEHANDELRHAGMLADRILQLGGTPILKPMDLEKNSNCGYESPDDPSVVTLVKQNIKGEQCAIDIYKMLAKLTRDADPVTYEMMVEILRDEVEHEDDLQQLEEDIKVGRKVKA